MLLFRALNASPTKWGEEKSSARDSSEANARGGDCMPLLIDAHLDLVLRVCRRCRLKVEPHVMGEVLRTKRNLSTDGYRE